MEVAAAQRTDDEDFEWWLPFEAAEMDDFHMLAQQIQEFRSMSQ